ncbi:MAG: hypothetical protein ACRDVK_04805 [Acidimicrobiia bacterium]
MSEPIVYIDHSDLREGRLADVKAGVRELVAFIESREPQLIAYGFYIDEEGMRMTLIAIHPDSSSLELHMKIGADAFRKFIELVDLRTIEVYCRPSHRVLEQLQKKVEMLSTTGRVVVHERFAGFAR